MQDYFCQIRSTKTCIVVHCSIERNDFFKHWIYSGKSDHESISTRSNELICNDNSRRSWQYYSIDYVETTDEEIRESWCNAKFPGNISD